MSYTQCAGAIVSHAQEVCQKVLPVMEQSTISTHTSTIQVGEYTMTLTLTKKSGVLGKRRAEPIEEVASPRPWQTPSKTLSAFYPKPSTDNLLYNSLGHNFSHQNPHPTVEPASVPFYIS